jgi:hypothetical protein
MFITRIMTTIALNFEIMIMMKLINYDSNNNSVIIISSSSSNSLLLTNNNNDE